MDLLIRGGAPARDGTLISVTPQRANWRYVGFEAARLAPGASRSWKHADREACVVVLGGSCELRAGGETLDASAGRATPFDGPPHALYAPPGMEIAVTARGSGVDVAIGTAPATKGARVQLFAPQDARLEVRGSGSMERRSHPPLIEGRAADRQAPPAS